MSLPNEQELLQRLSQGDENAFVAIYDYYRSSIFHFVQKFAKSPDLSEDLTQEIFIKVWEMGPDIMNIGHFRPYLFAIARNHIFGFFKKISSENLAKSELLRHSISARSNADENMMTREYMTFLQDILDSLPSRTKEIFLLCREEHQSYEEVAEHLGISRNAVKKHMVRSMKSIRKSIGQVMGITIFLYWGTLAAGFVILFTDTLL